MIDLSILDRLPRIGKNGPPRIESILQHLHTDDPLYDWTGLLAGPQGTWHRLWSTLCTKNNPDILNEVDGEDLEEFLHNELASHIGRRLLPSEYDLLKWHADAHYEVVAKPVWEKLKKELD